MPPTTLRTTAKACRDCGAPLDTSTAPNRLYCERDRERRRALTHLGRALPLAVAIDEPFAEKIRAAMRHGRELTS